MPARLTSLYRSPLPTSFAPAWAWIASIIVLVSAGWSHGVASGVRGAVAVFLAWALVRELAPMRPLPSLYVPFLAVGFAIPGHVDLLACLVALVAARVASRCVGDAPTWLDGALIIGLCAWAATRPTSMPVALVLAAILFVDDDTLRSRLLGAGAFSVTMVVAVLEGTLDVHPAWARPGTPSIVLLCILLVAALRLVAVRLPRRVRVRDDRRRAWLSGARVRSARVAVVASLVAVMAWTGSAGAFSLASVSAATVAVGLGGAKLRARRGPDAEPSSIRYPA